ncbi:hypothetical protein [Desertimonas flava]|uniref:hypothetical protein n=1 Tax=Desertimonas flava TaxID=2064846 RepID=UPI000E34B8CB|nr:hypothetical protein [Desertimonas flava]
MSTLDDDRRGYRATKLRLQAAVLELAQAQAEQRAIVAMFEANVESRAALRTCIEMLHEQLLEYAIELGRSEVEALDAELLDHLASSSEGRQL